MTYRGKEVGQVFDLTRSKKDGTTKQRCQVEDLTYIEVKNLRLKFVLHELHDGIDGKDVGEFFDVAVAVKLVEVGVG